MLNGTELHGQVVEELRKRAGWSQEALAAAVKRQVGVAIAQSTISRIERDAHETVRPITGRGIAEALAHALGRPVDEVLDRIIRKPEPTPQPEPVG